MKERPFGVKITFYPGTKPQTSLFTVGDREYLLAMAKIAQQRIVQITKGTRCLEVPEVSIRETEQFQHGRRVYELRYRADTATYWKHVEEAYDDRYNPINGPARRFFRSLFLLDRR